MINVIMIMRKMHMVINCISDAFEKYFVDGNSKDNYKHIGNSYIKYF